MQRFALALSAIVVGVVVSSCAVGVRQPATSITTTGATLNGKVLSTTGGPGSYFIEHAEFDFAFGTQFSERTPTRSVNFVVNQLRAVSEPVDGLPPGRTHYYRVCAEDSENPGDPFCSPAQSFRTVGDSVAGGAVSSVIMDLEGHLSIDVGSGPAGEDVSGSVSESDPVGRVTIGTPRCLRVSGRRAVIGIDWTPLSIGSPFSNYLVIQDGGPSGDDSVGRVASAGPPTDCAGVPDDVSLFGLGRSTIVVTDAEAPPT